MLDLYPPFRALQEANPAGWARTAPLQTPVRWAHPNGLQLLATQSLMWDGRFVLNDMAFHLLIPQLYPGSLVRDLSPLLHDTTRWIQTPDLEPRRRIAQVIGAWLTWHGRTGRAKIRMQRDRPTDLSVNVVWSTGRFESTLAPGALVQLLDSEIAALWQRAPVPDQHNAYIHVEFPLRIDRIPRAHARAFWAHLPTTAHGRMCLLAATPEVRALPLPRPAP